jgi:hypothetical protein
MDISQIKSINRAVILVSSLMTLFFRFGIRAYPFLPRITIHGIDNPLQMTKRHLLATPTLYQKRFQPVNPVVSGKMIDPSKEP